MQCTTIGIDIAKSVFQLSVANQSGKIIERNRLTRGQFKRYLYKQAGQRERNIAQTKPTNDRQSHNKLTIWFTRTQHEADNMHESSSVQRKARWVRILFWPGTNGSTREAVLTFDNPVLQCVIGKGMALCNRGKTKIKESLVN
jgi:hypothetical protein